MFERDSFGVNKNKLITRRMFVLSAAKIIVFTGIIGRMFSLQISENKKYSFLSEKNRLRAWKLPPKRGIFIPELVLILKFSRVLALSLSFLVSFSITLI